MLALLPLLAASSLANADIRPILRAQGFPGPINGREILKYAGVIRQNQNDYQIYVFRGVVKAATVDHGINWLILILNGSIYLGGYRIPMPADCGVQEQKIVCRPEAPAVVAFTNTGPPTKILFDGEVLPFQRGKKPRTR